jgi:beta-glucosidase
MSKHVEQLLDQMTLAEQVSLLAGRNMWNTVPNDRIGLEKMRVSDGPGGVRGSKFDGPASMNVPCGTAIAASWDTALVRDIGELLGKGCTCASCSYYQPASHSGGRTQL